MAENDRLWTPSSRQLKLAELLLNPDDRRPLKDKFAELKVPERTARRWMRDERYIGYLNSQIERFTDSQLVDVWRALINQARRGNVMAIKLFFELKNLYKVW